MPEGLFGIVSTRRKSTRSFTRGFTLTELLLVVVVIAILTLIGVITYQGVQRRSSEGVVTQTAADALKNLQVYYAFNRSYPSNVADTEYRPPLSAAVTLYTNTPQLPVYSVLTPDQNAQLFINACNGFMPITEGSTNYNTACVYNGNNAHIKGTVSSNVILHGPVIDEAEFKLTCGSSCDEVQQKIIAIFKAQGGSFPLTVPKNGSTLPAPTSMSTTGPATRFCLEARSATFDDLVYHASSESQKLDKGPCLIDAELHYP